MSHYPYDHNGHGVFGVIAHKIDTIKKDGTNVPSSAPLIMEEIMILQYELLEDIKDDIRVLKEQNELLDIKLQILRKKILFDTIVFHGCAAFIIISMIAVSHMS